MKRDVRDDPEKSAYSPVETEERGGGHGRHRSRGSLLASALATLALTTVAVALVLSLPNRKPPGVAAAASPETAQSSTEASNLPASETSASATAASSPIRQTEGPTNTVGEPSESLASFLADPNSRLSLEPLPPGAPDVVVTRAQAIDKASNYMNITGDPVFVDHGVGTIIFSADGVPSTDTVWLVVLKNTDRTPFPVGPDCPDKPNGVCAWAVTTYGAAMVSDQSGEVLRYVSGLEEVPPPQ